ncbi:MAG TPA: cyclopropane-fatty-acyl-phospholipid synthase family protein [Acidimicrobiales bacterium]|nr:cyclopropane-fatty-acyl-phospholipid synthase family protein [Acidimicrobiales bacterium]
MSPTGGLARAVTSYLHDLFGTALPVRIRAWDGSESGPPDATVVVLRSPDALRYLLWSPGELGLARAYVTGSLDVEGDLETGLSRVLGAARGGAVKLSPSRVARGVKLMAALGGLGRPLAPPRSEARPRGRRHSLSRDAQVISHHYDLSNDFYSLLLDGSMAYSCGYWTDDRPGYSLADAQRDKLDLICRKLALRPGARLLDVGCGWGSLTVHAAREYGASVTAVTVAAEQQAFVAGRLRAEGVEHLVDLRRCDYRQVLADPGAGFDAVAAVEMGEHVGDGNYPAFLAGLHASLEEEGRLLIQVMSRGARNPGGGPFIERYIAPDMHMRPVGRTVELLEACGFEVRDVHAMREHYARTIRAWSAEMERRWDEVVTLIGEEQARVWRLYLAGGALSFAQNRMGVDQILSVRPGREGRAGMPATRIGWEQPAADPVAPARGR